MLHVAPRCSVQPSRRLFSELATCIVGCSILSGGTTTHGRTMMGLSRSAAACLVSFSAAFICSSCPMTHFPPKFIALLSFHYHILRSVRICGFFALVVRSLFCSAGGRRCVVSLVVAAACLRLQVASSPAPPAPGRTRRAAAAGDGGRRIEGHHPETYYQMMRGGGVRRGCMCRAAAAINRPPPSPRVGAAAVPARRGRSVR